jgi:hypothetical protein
MAFKFEMTEDPARFGEAIESFAGRRVVSRDEADALEGYARKRVWWISGVAQMDVANDAHKSIQKALEDGVSFDEWKRTVGPKLQAAWGHEDAHRLLTVYRNATHQAYAAGRDRQMRSPSVLALRPFHEFVSVEDGRACEVCPTCNGTILPVGHPWWLSHSPQLHHCCRCQKRSLRRTVAERRGITVDPPDVAADEGFGLPPEESTPPKPVERKEAPEPHIHRELYLKQERDSKRRKPRAIPEKLVATNEDAEIFKSLRKVPVGTTREEANALAELRIAALQRLPETLDRKRAKELIVATGADVPVDVAMEFPRLVGALGNHLHVYDLEDATNGSKVLGETRGLARMDPSFLARVVHQRKDDFVPEFEGVFIGSRKLTDMDGMTRMSGVRPRGWPEGKTWEIAGGAGGASSCVVSVSGESGSYSTIRHELGHVIGGRLIVDAKKLDDNPELILHHKRLFPKLSAYFRQEGPGGHAGRQEMLAESIANLYGWTPEFFDIMYDREYREWLSKILGKQ